MCLSVAAKSATGLDRNKVDSSEAAPFARTSGFHSHTLPLNYLEPHNTSVEASCFNIDKGVVDLPLPINVDTSSLNNVPV